MFGETAYGLCGNGAIHGSIHCRVYFSGPTFLVLAEISLDRGYPPLLKYTLVPPLRGHAQRVTVAAGGIFSPLLFSISSKPC